MKHPSKLLALAFLAAGLLIPLQAWALPPCSECGNSLGPWQICSWSCYWECACAGYCIQWEEYGCGGLSCDWRTCRFPAAAVDAADAMSVDVEASWAFGTACDQVEEPAVSTDREPSQGSVPAKRSAGLGKLESATQTG